MNSNKFDHLVLKWMYDEYHIPHNASIKVTKLEEPKTRLELKPRTLDVS